MQKTLEGMSTLWKTICIELQTLVHEADLQAKERWLVEEACTSLYEEEEDGL